MGTKSNRDGIGAKVEVAAGALKQQAERVAGSGYLSQDDWRLHFGLGAVARAERITVTWPSGIRQMVENVAADQVVTIRRNSDAAAFLMRCMPLVAVMSDAPPMPARYPSPDDMALSADGNAPLCGVRRNGRIGGGRPRYEIVGGRVRVGSLPRGVAVSPDGARIYVANSWSDTISEIDAARCA